MRKDPGFAYRLTLLFGDAFAIVFSFAFAYYFRINIDHRAYYFDSQIGDFVIANIFLLPIWLIILSSLGLYSKRVLQSRPLKVLRLFLASVIGVMTIITYDFFASGIFNRGSLFPVRVIALYAILFCFIMLLLMRWIISMVHRISLRHDRGLIRTVIIGDSDNTTQLLQGISPESGFKVVGVVANNDFIPQEWRKRKYPNLSIALKNLRPDAIIHTDTKNIEENNKAAIEHHALYYYSPAESSIITLGGNVEFVAAIPIILIRTTPLNGGARIYKRIMDIIFGVLFVIAASIPMLIIFIIQKIIAPRAPAIYKDTRLTRYNNEFALLKFRSMKPEYCGLTPEEAFEKMGHAELSSTYREQGDYLKNDPRYTKFGKFLRRTSLDELPQFFNVLKGDISLIGPRALQPQELKHYGDRGLILSVKSGLTGLAQVSGRRNISFNERRALDIYYVQNWTPALDVQIFFRTIGCVFHREGAK
ncbi:exopolysaccharide biosynthesis polyprenyl glycosylphosphotransferase [Candidatus Saccharibacteria bacterium]|nr:exopolysaccharide biosynthesis polyprenyl glycosylphosphotransferase [Candidatus Saccharibacteria bacterium]